MAKLDRIADVVISLRTTAIQELSFSDMLILGPHTLSPARSMLITGADELLDMGMLETDPVYMAARDAFSQIPTVRQVYIGRRNVASVTLSVPTASATPHRVTVQWRDPATLAVQSATGEYVGLPDDTAEDIATGLAAAINGTAAPVTATATTTTVTLAPDVAGTGFGLRTVGNIVTAPVSSNEGIGAALSAVADEFSNWYGFVITSRDPDDQMAAAAWAEANEKLFGAATDDPNALDPLMATDIGARMQENQYFRSYPMYNSHAATQYPDAALMANRFTYYPGSETWALQKLAGISYDNLTEGQSLAAREKGYTTFELFRNFAVTQGGRTAAGEWIDVIRFRDALVDQIKVSVVSAMINADGKVPYTDDGIQIIGNAIRGPLELNVRRGGIAPQELDANDNLIPSYTLTLPRSIDVPFNDKANRILRDVKFTARLAGAIHMAEIKGSLSYSL